MFTGIIESVGTITKILKDKSNVHFTIHSNLSNELKIDQSVSHEGVCLTVVEVEEGHHTVTAINETIEKTNMSFWCIGTSINLERCTRLGDRLDGHIVQGHVDETATCIKREEFNGSWKFTFKGDNQVKKLTVNKGSVSINGVSLTIVNSKNDTFSVAIIPYTFENTTFRNLNEGSLVNLEFDVIGKYVSKLMTSD